MCAICFVAIFLARLILQTNRTDSRFLFSIFIPVFSSFAPAFSISPSFSVHHPLSLLLLAFYACFIVCHIFCSISLHKLNKYFSEPFRCGIRSRCHCHRMSILLLFFYQRFDDVNLNSVIIFRYLEFEWDHKGDKSVNSVFERERWNKRMALKYGGIYCTLQKSIALSGPSVYLCR